MSQNDKHTKLGPVESNASVALLGVVNVGTKIFDHQLSLLSDRVFRHEYMLKGRTIDKIAVITSHISSDIKESNLVGL